MSVGFVHLHVHSEFSLVDSTLRIAPLVESCAQNAMPAVALTDENNLFALVKFHQAAAAAGIKPIAGCDVWMVSPDDPRPWRLTLLCQNRVGYLNLSRLISRAWREGQHGGHALVADTWLNAETTQGLIALCGFRSRAARHALSAGGGAVHQDLSPLAALFPDRLYLELTRTGRAGEEDWNRAALAAGEHLDLPLVASNDVCFARREDFESHEARVCIHQGRVLADPRRPHDYSPEQYLKSPEEMAPLFGDLPELLENTVELAKRCNLELELGTYYLPRFPVPEGHDLDSYIRERASEGLTERLTAHGLAPGRERGQYDERLEHELGTILQMGFPGYFLIVSDFIGWAKEHDIPVGPGRGSGAGSLVAWALGITDLDPLRFNLLFERFLNPERVSMPDFDIDFCMDKRDRVIDYVAGKYGRDHVSQIITYGSMAAKAVLRDCGRVLGMPYGQVDRIAKLIPARPLDLTLADALGRSKKSEEDRERIVKEFCALYDTDDEARALIDLALKLEGLTRNAGKHAGGVVIAPSPLTDFSPLYCEPGGDGIVTQFDKNDVETVGLVKFDFLGLRTLTIIDWAVKAINARRAQAGESVIDITQIPLDDRAVYALLKQAQTVAVFQLESGGMQRMLKDAKPDRFEDIIALVALYRPGPMDLIPSYIRRKHGEEEVSYPDPRVESVLSETYGIMVYQEQVMQMAQIVGGYTLGSADLLRRAMGKKKLAEMVKQRAVFAAGAAENGLSQRQADAIFDLMEKFAGYGFNKSHATAYALVSYQTAWLKAHYPAEFMAATLSSDMDNTDKVVIFLQETHALGLELLPPDVNASTWMFEAVKPDAIRYGLGAIKGVGRGVCEAIASERAAHGAYRDLADFCLRVKANGLNKRVLEALALSGALDALAANRASAIAQLPGVIKAAEQHQHNASAGQNDMFGASAGAQAGRIRIELPDVADWPLEQRLAGERDTLGHYLSGHPTQPWRDVLDQLATCPLGEIVARYQPPAPREGENGGNRYRRAPETPWTVAGMVVALRKRGDTAAFARLEDETGGIEVSFFREAFDQYAELLVRDALLVVEGGLCIDAFSGNHQVRARRVLTLSEACEQLARLVRIRVNGIGADFLPQLREALSDYRGGSTPLRLAGYRNANARADIDLGEDWQVHARPELVRALRALPGVLDAQLRLARVG
jgi:DNA polymerase-3 subunit alpha